MELAELLRDNRQFDGAIQEFREAMRIDPFLSDQAYSGISETLLKQNKQAEAEALLREALADNPDLVEVRGDLGIILLNQGKNAEAAGHFRRALEIDPGRAMPHANLGFALAKQGNLPEAIEHYRQFLQIKPDHLLARHHFASLLARTGQFRQSVAEYRQVLERQGDYVPASVALARILAACEDPDVRNGSEAVRIMDRVCGRAGEKNLDYLSTQAMAYAEAGQFDKAVATAENALLLAEIRGLKEFVPRLQRELSLYKQAKPYRDRR